MKIEKGCLAIVVGGECPSDPYTNIGKIVIVGNFIGSIIDCSYKDLWEVNTPMETTWGNKIYLQREKYLQRIDEPPEQETITDELEITESA